MNMMNHDEMLAVQLAELKMEHRALDHMLEELGQNPFADQVAIKRLKKNKLRLRDQITKIEDQLYPDIIA